jgi:hypothetical protein
MTLVTRVLIACAAAGVLQTAGAACTYPPEVSMPDGASASEADMRAASAAVKEYMAAVETYLACLDEEEKAMGDAVTEEQKKVHTGRHNAAVDALNVVAARYNEQVQAYKKQEK